MPLAVKDLAEKGNAGFARRIIFEENDNPGVRLALKRVGTGKRSKKETIPPNPDPPRQSERATQAVLGMLGKEGKSEEKLGSRLDQLSPDDLQRLAKLVAAAGAEKQDRSQILENVEEQLAARGIKLLVKAGSVTINIGNGGGQSTAQTACDRSDHETSFQNQSDHNNGMYDFWPRRLSRIRDFIMGH